MKLITFSNHSSINSFLNSGETDLIKKGEGEDVGLLSGTQVMEGSGRMLVVGVGLNSQVGSIMNLLGATASGNDKKKDKKDSKATKVTPNVTKESTPIEVKKTNDTNENNQNKKEEAVKTAPAGVAQLAADAEEEGEDAVTNDSKHKCKLK